MGNVSNQFPIADEYLLACGQAGHKVNPDLNATKQGGVAWFPHTIKRGRRKSSATAFLKVAKSLTNPSTIPFAEVRRVILENSRAVAVACLLKGREKTFKASSEVVICGGAINSPKLLELSGIGNKGLLEKMNIPLVLDLPGAGENFHDHWNGYIKQQVKAEGNSYTEAKPWASFRSLLRYVATGESFLVNPAALVAVFYKSLEQSGRAESQIHFAPAASEVDASANMVPIV